MMIAGSIGDWDTADADPEWDGWLSVMAVSRISTVVCGDGEWTRYASDSPSDASAGYDLEVNPSNGNIVAVGHGWTEDDWTSGSWATIMRLSSEGQIQMEGAFSYPLGEWEGTDDSAAETAALSAGKALVGGYASNEWE